MYPKPAIKGARLILCVAAAAGTLFAMNPAAAQDHKVMVVLHVSTQGLDLSQPTDARTFYTRIENAAWEACTRGNRADLLPVDDLKACYQKAIGRAVRAANAPTLTRIYLESHTLQDAAAHGIEVPAQLARVPSR